MKKIVSIVLTICMLLSLSLITGCGESKTVDEQFADSLMAGLSARWVLTDKDEADVNKVEKKSDYEGYINAELDQVSKYKEEKFEDKELGELAKSYIDVLEQSMAALDDFNNDNKFYAEWDNVCNDRYELLAKLNDKLDLQFTDESDVENFEGLLSQGKVVTKVRELQKNTKFEQTNSDYGWNTYSAVVENTTGEDFEYFSFEIKLLDKDGVTVENTSAYADNWNAGDKCRFEFETDTSFEKMEIANCDYSFE